MHLAQSPRDFLAHLHGATIFRHAGRTVVPAEVNAVADKQHPESRKVCVMPDGGSNATGALGYDAEFASHNKSVAAE